MLQPGQPAPEFALYNTKKELVRLSDFRNRPVVLLFFPLAFTSVCTKELCSVRDNISVYNQSRAEVLGISVDSLYTLGRFREEQNLNFQLLSDFNRTVSRAYDALYPEFSYGMHEVSKRAAFVINGHGTLTYAEVLENAGEIPDFNAVQNAILTNS